MATYTPNYNFYLPALGDGVLNAKPWGARINANFSTIDTTMHTFEVAIAGLQDVATPAFTSSNNGQFLGVVAGALTWATVQALPAYSTDNNGQYLGIVAGVPTWSTVQALPSYSTSNNGQVLGIVTGTPTWVTPTGSSYVDEYSTSETTTNKTWLTKQVYRKVVSIGPLPGAFTTKSVAHGVSGITAIVNVYGWASDGTNWLPLGYPAYSSIATSMYASGTYINVAPYSDMTSYTTAYAVIEYTKT